MSADTTATRTSHMSQWDVAVENALPAERARLVGLCAHLTGSRDAAEDLAHETLYEAWRSRHKLRDPAGLAPWLNAIARNVCRRWQAERAQAPLSLPDADDDALAQAGDLGAALEREERVALLGRALASVPSEARSALTARYVDELSPAESARRLGVSEGALKMRLQRGKAALRQTFAGELRDEAQALGLVAGDEGGWRETPIWCTTCGVRRLFGRFSPATGDYALRCLACSPHPAHTFVESHSPELLRGVQGYKPAFARIVAWGHAYYRGALRTQGAACVRCVRPATLRMRMPEYAPPPGCDYRGMTLHCPACGYDEYISLGGLNLWLPEAQRFWRSHPRMRAAGEYPIEFGGRPAIVMAWESVVDSARLTVIAAHDTYEALHVTGDSVHT